MTVGNGYVPPSGTLSLCGSRTITWYVRLELCVTSEVEQGFPGHGIKNGYYPRSMTVSFPQSNSECLVIPNLLYPDPHSFLLFR